MSTSYALANIQHSLQALKELIPPGQWSSTPLPVIAAPGWWISDLCAEMGVDAGCEVASVYECAVIRSEDVTEPWLIDHDGKKYPVLPKWQRARPTTDADAEVEVDAGAHDD